jgi:hypothetical protein
MLTLAYEPRSAVKVDKMYVTGKIVSANCTSWMGPAWNGFHALKRALHYKHAQLWGAVEAK